jgi:hypothetical protein
MNELQAEKLRDVIAKITEETGESINISSVTDGEKYFLVYMSIKIPIEGNPK